MAEPNPYTPPATPDTLCRRPARVQRYAGPPIWDFRSIAELAVLLLIAPAAGFFLFGAAYIAYGLAVETYVLPMLRPPGQPMLSYGQQAAVSCLLVSALGAVTGLLAIVARFPMVWFALVVPPSAAALLGWLALSWWEESRVEYGPDLSDSIVFAPMLGASCLVIVLTVVVGMTRVRPYLRQLA